MGRIDDEFPLLKFWNLLDEKNNKRYEQMVKKTMKGAKGDVKTFG